jgi:DNA-directed RNA polymerase specialized sigma54-like protein
MSIFFTEKLSEHLKWWIKLIKLNKLDLPLSMDTILSNNPYSEREDFSGFVGIVSNSFHQYSVDTNHIGA